MENFLTSPVEAHPATKSATTGCRVHTTSSRAIKYRAITSGNLSKCKSIRFKSKHNEHKPSHSDDLDHSCLQYLLSRARCYGRILREQRTECEIGKGAAWQVAMVCPCVCWIRWNLRGATLTLTLTVLIMCSVHHVLITLRVVIMCSSSCARFSDLCVHARCTMVASFRGNRHGCLVDGRFRDCRGSTVVADAGKP